ncbi:MAG: hypothetical protein ACI8SZ_002471 [Colwellia sp.]
MFRLADTNPTELINGSNFNHGRVKFLSLQIFLYHSN